MKSTDELIRVVKTPQAQSDFKIDETHKSPGRGAYVCKGELCLPKALKARGFERSFKCKVPAEIYDRLAMF